MKEKNEFRMLVKERQKRGWDSSLWMDLLLLLLPSFLLCLVFLLSLYSFILSFFSVYFILPMFYTVERRIRFRLTGIGKRDFSYKDGYLAFFKERKGGIFGAISTFILSFTLLLLSYVLFSGLFPYLANLYPESDSVYQTLSEMRNNPYLRFSDITEYLQGNLCYLNRPLSIFVSLCCFLPVFSFLFLSIPMNLTNHQLSTIVLPDIDKNLSASQARSLAKNSFGRFLQYKHVKYHFAYNWPFMVIFALLYGTSGYLTSLISTTNSSLVPLLVIITPTVSVFYGLILQYFVIYNDYALIEELSKSLPSLLPQAMKAYISQAFTNPNYIHGEESAFRGPFIAEQRRYEEDKEQKAPADMPKEEESHGIVVDFTKKEDEK